MADPSYISKSVAMSLAMVSGGTCYWPDPRCMKPVTEDVDGDKVLSVQIAHIRAARPDGPRYVKEMSDHDRRRFGNLILLCSTHHNIIDTIAPDKYSIDGLDKWKRDREGKSFDVLKDVLSPDESRLQSLINESLKEQNKILAQQITRFEDALTKLAAIDSDAAGILKQRMSTANRELEAARMLMHTQDSSLWMRDAGQLLAHTQETALFLLQAAQDLRGLDGKADLLLVASQQMEGAALKLQSAADILITLDSRLERRINDLRNMGDGY
jgi:hypothetical protein